MGEQNDMNKKQGQLLSERFEVAFNQVHDALRDIVQINDDRFVVLVKVGAKKWISFKLITR
jgi:hypothetical protein